ncbi:flagellar basal body-associated protein FliL [Methylobacterium symbioticum]|jgi:flagellar FliL protein|uniref:Flagellar protein FliL n=1 Tax=Methylobacterium symbioticum TaxID=2584084 RepID=A0A509E743_9HYPH|nr:flagellar basal body-associated protein FliL [Methylobacterium symbioticum]VUD69474.1 Flagellar FliL protein [Methylobacterium symbioticum]
MAKKPKKAPAEGEAAEAEAPKSKKKLIIIGAVALLALGGGGAFVMKKRAAAHAEGEHAQVEEKKPVVFLDVREMILNLTPEANQDKAKFAKIRIALELKDAKVESEVKPLMPRVEDTLQVYMRELRASDLSGSAGLYRLREELLRRVNVATYPAKVEAVLFKDVIIQ